MIKVLYNEDGTITDFWAIEDIPATPFIEISEDDHKMILNKDSYKVINNKLTDVSDTEEYKIRKNEEDKIEKQRKIKEQMIEIEKQQARAIRELMISDNDYSRSKILAIETQMQELRDQL